MENIVSVECLNQYTPPQVRITLLGQLPFDVSWGAYEILQRDFGFPPLICGAYSVGQ